MSELLEREQEMVSATMSKRLSKLEEQVSFTVFHRRFGLFMFSGSVSDGECLVFWQVSESTKALRWIIDALKSQGCKSKMQPPLMSEQSVFISALIRCTVCIMICMFDRSSTFIFIFVL